MKWRRVAAALCGALSLACPVRAGWLQASTDHFIIEANSSEARLRDFAGRLERFDAALRKIYGVGDDPARRFNRVVIIATGPQEIARLAGSRSVAGFYRGAAGHSVIFTSVLTSSTAVTPEAGTRIASGPGYDLGAQAVLLHEYSHHFMFSNFPNAYPTWFCEGFAEFNGNAEFRADGTVIVGAAANYRAEGLLNGSGLSIETLLNPPRQMTPWQIDELYGRGWLLTHYLLVEGGKQDQLNQYLHALNAGQPSLEAARIAFGDLHELSRQIDNMRYANHLGGLAVSVPPVANIAIKPLSAGAAAMMPLRMRLAAGVDKKAAGSLVADAERQAAAYPGDSRVNEELAGVEWAAGRYDQADEASNRALRDEPQNLTALLYKGRVAEYRLQATGSKDGEAWKAARGWFIRANHLAPDAAESLMLYYESYVLAGNAPPQVAFDGLARAQQLAPEDDRIRMLMARHFIAGNRLDEARVMLRPIAYAPDGDRASRTALAALDALAAGRTDAAQTALIASTETAGGS